MTRALRRIARARALVHAGSPSSVVTSGGRLGKPSIVLTRGLRSHVGPRWTVAAAFATALRMYGTGELLPAPACGICGRVGVEPLDRWLDGHRTGSLL